MERRASARPLPVRGRRSFDELRAHGLRARTRLVSVIALPDPSGTTVRVSYAIGRRVGPAVVRNRVRRRLRALVAAAPLAPGRYLVSATALAATADAQELRQSLEGAFERLLRTVSDRAARPEGSAASSEPGA